MELLMKNYTYRNSKIAYSLEGEGECIVLLHGFLHDATMWNNYKSKWLKTGYSVLCLDLPGHGNSDVIENLSIETIADILNEILKEEKLNKVNIIGHSLGGYSGLAFAKKYPENLNKLILFHSSAFADSEEVKKKRDLWLKIIAKHPAMFMKSVIEYLYTKENVVKHQNIIQADIEKAKQNAKDAYVDIIKAMRDRPDTLAVLKSNTQVYFLAGKHDKVIPEEVSKAQIAMIKNGSGLILENASHMSFVEDADNAFNALNGFLEA